MAWDGGIARRSRTVSLPSALAASAAYLVVAGLVATGHTRGVDARVYQLFRPHGVWGDNQLLTGTVVRGLQPRVVVSLLGAVALATAGWRRSWRPLVLATVLVGATGAGAVVTKLLIGRVGTAGALSGGLGSFPSGHAASVIVCGAGVAIVLRSRVSVWEWLLVAGLACAQSISLLSIGLHWVSDVLGGLLLGVAIVAAVVASATRFDPS
jgi:membrane-associated phospholipid phosphatase